MTSSRSRGSRRRRKRDFAGGIAPKEAIASRTRAPSGFSNQQFARVDAMAWSFATRRFASILPALARGFFGAASPRSQDDPTLQAAFRAFVVLGWREASGRRIIDLFVEHGISLHGAEHEARLALQQSRLGMVVVDELEAASGLLVGSERLRNEPVILVERHAAAIVSTGDALLSWHVPDGERWRPIGVATHVPAAAVTLVEKGLEQLAESHGITLAELPERHPAHVFWLVYRLVQGRPAQ